MKFDMVWSVTGAACYLGVSRGTIHRYIKDGIFPEPCEIVNMLGTDVKGWSPEVLEKFRPKMKGVGNPNFKKKKK